MNPLDLTARLDEERPALYLGVGALSMAKAAALREHPGRARRELRDAALFLGVGAVLGAYQRRRRDGAEDGDPADRPDGSGRLRTAVAGTARALRQG